MRGRTGSGIALAVVAAVLAADASAASAVTYRGATSQGFRAGVRVGTDGLARRVMIHWVARCRSGDARFREITSFAGPMPNSTATAFDAAGSYRLRLGRRLHARVSVRLHGRQVNPHLWRGNFSGSAVIVRHGRRIDSCRLRKIRWRASVPMLVADITSDEGDYIGQGGTYSFRSPQDRPHVKGNRTYVSVQFNGWAFTFEAPKGRTLKPGHFAGATRYPFNDRKTPGLDASAESRGCNEVEGEFTVHSSSFFRNGDLRSIDVSFVHYCEGGEHALRGRLQFAFG